MMQLHGKYQNYKSLSSPITLARTFFKILTFEMFDLGNGIEGHRVQHRQCMPFGGEYQPLLKAKHAFLR